MKLSQYKNFVTDSVIYGIQNINTNKWYIGSCTNFRARVVRHYYYLRHNNHHSNKLQRSWNKHGEDAFDIMILYTNTTLTDKQLVRLEESFIKAFDSFENGYNMTDRCGVYEKFNLTEDQIKKFVSTRTIPVIGINRFTNKVIGEYESVSAAANVFGDQSTNISACCKHRLNYVKNTVFVYKSEYDPDKNYTTKGIGREKPKSPEHVEKMKHSPRCIPVYKYDSEKNLIETYFSKSEAERQNNFHRDRLRLERGDKTIGEFTYSYNKYEKDIV